MYANASDAAEGENEYQEAVKKKKKKATDHVKWAIQVRFLYMMALLFPSA